MTDTVIKGTPCVLKCDESGEFPYQGYMRYDFRDAAVYALRCRAANADVAFRYTHDFGTDEEIAALAASEEKIPAGALPAGCFVDRGEIARQREVYIKGTPVPAPG